MRLNEITDKPGAKKKRVRIGRGIGSGVGKTGGRGVKGQGSRAGVALGGFEGGQMPLHRRLPKRGFTMPGRLSFAIVNTGDLQRAIDGGRLDPAKPVDAAALIEAGLLRRKRDGLRLLGNGELKAKLAIAADHASASAKAAVEKAGGSITLIEKKVFAADEAKAKKSAAKKTASSKGKPKAGGEE